MRQALRRLLQSDSPAILQTAHKRRSQANLSHARRLQSKLWRCPPLYGSRYIALGNACHNLERPTELPRAPCKERLAERHLHPER